VLYISQAPALDSTKTSDLVGTLRWIARYRGAVIVLPFVIAGFAPLFRSWFIVVFCVMAATFAQRSYDEHVNYFGIDRMSRPFYGDFIDSPAFDRSLHYRVLEPNDREDGAYQLMRNGAVLAQEFFDQSQFRRWWNSGEQYACFLGAKHVDIVLLEKDYPLKFDQNEDTRLREFEERGTARVIYRDPRGQFTAYDVRAARSEGARLDDCGL
jgi:hypothetical protein